MSKGIYTIGDVADILNLTKKTVRLSLARAGYTPPEGGAANAPYCTEEHIAAVARTCGELHYCAVQSCRFCRCEHCTILNKIPYVCTFYKPKEVTA